MQIMDKFNENYLVVFVYKVKQYPKALSPQTQYLKSTKGEDSIDGYLLKTHFKWNNTQCWSMKRKSNMEKNYVKNRSIQLPF